MTVLAMSDVQNTTRTAPCGLYLVLPEDWYEPAFLRGLSGFFRAINASPYEKNNHVIELRRFDYNGQDDAEMAEKIMALAEVTKSQGVNFIVAGDIALAKSCNADGVLVETVEDVKAARDAMGSDPIVGMRCGTSRRKAEQALEAGADYVSFHDAANSFVDPSIVRWWALKTQDHPCLVEGPINNDNCAFYVQAGAYFIEASDYVWNNEKGIMQGVVNMTYAIDLASGIDRHAEKRSVQ